MKKVRFDIPIETDKHIVYPERGEIYNKQSQNFCGYIDKGYKRFNLNGKVYKNHRYIYEMYHNIKLTPEQEIDHIDRNKLNNKIENLRISDRVRNNQNRESVLNSTSIYKGVSWFKRDNKWRSSITVNGKQIHLGLYKNEKLAGLSYNIYANQLNKKYDYHFLLNKF
jgi:hypothetical protein